MSALIDKIDDFTYSVTLYDWDVRNDDYIAGHLRRSDECENAGSYYWRFYPLNDLSPMSAGDLDSLSKKIVRLNIG